MAALAHEVTNPLVHGYARGGYQTRHARHDAVIARRNHIGARAQNGHEFKHIVFVRREDRRAGQACGDVPAGNGIKPFHGHQNRKHAMALAESFRGIRKGGDVMAIFAIDVRPGLMEIDGAVLAVLVCAGGDPRQIFADRRFHWPYERMNWT